MRLLHTMLRVGDLQRSIEFYTNVLGMKLLRTSENPEYKYSLAFVGYGEESDTAVIELTYNWGVDSYELGTAYGHIALSVDNAAQACNVFARMAAISLAKLARLKAAARLSPLLKIRTATKLS